MRYSVRKNAGKWSRQNLQVRSQGSQAHRAIPSPIRQKNLQKKAQGIPNQHSIDLLSLFIMI